MKSESLPGSNDKSICSPTTSTWLPWQRCRQAWIEGDLIHRCYLIPFIMNKIGYYRSNMAIQNPLWLHKHLDSKNILNMGTSTALIPKRYLAYAILQPRSTQKTYIMSIYLPYYRHTCTRSVWNIQLSWQRDPEIQSIQSLAWTILDHGPVHHLTIPLQSSTLNLRCLFRFKRTKVEHGWTCWLRC